MIQADNLVKKYGTEVVFENISFEALQGSFTIIQGKSGSGKTTLLNILATIDEVDGILKIDGVSIEKLNEHQRAKFRAKNIGFIFQSYALIPEFSIIENCTIPLIMDGMSKQDAIIQAKKVITKLIPEADEQFFTKNPTQLSGGQQQRVSIARALIHDPKIIIADEPTANLDEVASKEVKQWLKELSKEKCIIVVTHEKEYQKYADFLYEFVDDTTKKAKSVLKGPVCLKDF